MAFRVKIEPEARVDIQSAIDWYNEQKKSYISRIERGLSDIQISTYHKLIQIGLGRQLTISIGK